MNDPVPLVAKLTVPVGTEAPELAVSVTVAVQDVDAPEGTGDGEHDTAVLVGLKPGVIVCITWLG